MNRLARVVGEPQVSELHKGRLSGAGRDSAARASQQKAGIQKPFAFSGSPSIGGRFVRFSAVRRSARWRRGT
jgi:hypothetical protein